LAAWGVRVSVEQARPGIFAVEVNLGGGEAVLVLHGELDLWAQPQLAAALASVENSYARVILDLADLHFIDGGNVILIHRARERARSRGCALILQSPNPQVIRILELTGLSPGVPGEEVLNPIVLPLPSRAYDRAAP
jgi:anti-anti-sigma factor